MHEKAQILIVDNNISEWESLRNLLPEQQYDLYFAQSGVEGIAQASTIHPDAIMLDSDLPYVDGYAVCSLIRSHYLLGETPVFLLLNQEDANIGMTGLKAGADDFFVRPFDKDEILGHLQGIILMNRYRLLIEEQRLAERAKSKTGERFAGALEGWAQVLDICDRETKGHILRVTELTLALAAAAGLDEKSQQYAWQGAMLHDLGILGIPDEILKKPSGFTENEWKLMREHPVYAYRWFSAVESLRPALDIPYCHHEKWDGTGYPRGLKGEEIPLTARLFAVADVWDALLSDRSYRRAFSTGEARKYIEEQAGKHFDPKVVELFLRVVVNN